MKNYTLGLYEKAMPSTLTWKEKFLTAKEAGFDYIEISIDESDEKLSRLDWSENDIKQILDASHCVGIPLGSMCLSAHRKYPLGSICEKTRTMSLEIMKKACILCSKLGIRYIQLAGYDVYYEDSTTETVEFFKTNLLKCTQMAAKYGILLGFETMETPFMDTVEKSIKYVSLINSPYLNIYPDIGNLNNAALLYNHSVIEDINKGNGRFIAAHIKETKPGHYREVPFSNGVVNFEELITACWENGIRRFVVEMWYTGKQDWKSDLVYASQLASNILNKM